MRPYAFRLTLLFSVLTFVSCARAQTQPKQTPNHARQSTENPLISEFPAFSANVTGGIARDHDRKIYRSGKWMRLDFEDSYRVNDLETLEMWSVGATRCVQFNRPDAGSYPFSAYHDFNVERSLTPDEETVDGHLCKIEVLTFTPKDDRPITARMRLWRAQDLGGFPIRIDVEDSGQTFTSTYTNVTLSAPDPKLFEHPAKCSGGLQPGQAGVVRVDKPAAR